MKTLVGVCGFVLILFTAISGCNEQKFPPAEVADEEIEYFAPGPEFKLSREAAAAKEQVATPPDASPAAEISAEKPPRKTVFESLYQAVRHGAAEAVSEDAGQP